MCCNLRVSSRSCTVINWWEKKKSAWKLSWSRYFILMFKELFHNFLRTSIIKKFNKQIYLQQKINQMWLNVTNIICYGKFGHDMIWSRRDSHSVVICVVRLLLDILVTVQHIKNWFDHSITRHETKITAQYDTVFLL